MYLEDFVAGSYRQGYEYKFFMPNKINHSYIWKNSQISQLLEIASLKLGELNSFSQLVPDTGIFIKMHIYKEAVVSSRIEGTRTNMEEALIKENEIEPENRDDWKEVNNYVNAMSYAIAELENLPLSNRLIKNIHKILLSSGRGEYKSPGEFRISQNWIGGLSLADAIFIPPIPAELGELLSDFEKFLNTPGIPHLIKIAIAHYQFETIHPFLDGNGRIGRLLITLYLVANDLMTEPLLYLSDFFEKNKNLYYENLTLVRTDNALVRWVIFFLTGVIQTAERSVSTLQKIIRLKGEREQFHIVAMGRRSKIAMTLFNKLFIHPVVTVREVQKLTGLSVKAAGEIVHIFLEKKILIETTGYRRNRVFVFQEYLSMFEP